MVQDHARGNQKHLRDRLAEHIACPRHRSLQILDAFIGSWSFRRIPQGLGLMNRAARGCHPCLRYDLLPVSPVRTKLGLVAGEGLEPPTPGL